MTPYTVYLATCFTVMVSRGHFTNQSWIAYRSICVLEFVFQRQGFVTQFQIIIKIINEITLSIHQITILCNEVSYHPEITDQYKAYLINQDFISIE